MQKKLLFIIPFLLIVFLAFSLRWWQIGSVAPGISIDEVDYMLNAKSFYLTGQDLGNKIHTLDVLRFAYPKTDDTKAELPYLLLLPFDGPFPFSLPLTRLPFVLMSVGSVLLLFGIANFLLGKRAGYIAGVLGAINPFLVVLGRSNYEVTGATFFFLLSFYLLLRLKGNKIFLTIPALLCAFYVYIGTKLLFIPFVLLALFMAYFTIQNKKYGKQYLTVGVILLAFVGIYVAILHATPTNRLGELLTPNSKEIIKKVNDIRQISLPSSLNSIVINKYTVFTKTVITNLSLVFSSDYFLSVGDGFFRLYNHGVVYYLDSFFMLLGLMYFAVKKRAVGIYLLGFIVIATIPQLIHDDSGISTNYAHASLVFPFLILLTTAGVEYLLNLSNKNWIRYSSLIGIAVLYGFSLLTFVQAYFYQYPLAGKDDYETRLLSKYITLAQKENKPVIVLSPVSVNHFKKYLFYANALNSSTISDVKKAFIAHNNHLGNVSFGSCMQHPVFPKGTIVIEDFICGNSDFSDHNTIPLILDGGIAYKVYQDSICNTYSLKRYPTDLTLASLAVENLSKKDFCETFITHL